MTGFAVLYQQRMHLLRGSPVWAETAGGKLPISGADHPLVIQKSNFVASSEEHLKLIPHIEAARRRLKESQNVSVEG